MRLKHFLSVFLTLLTLSVGQMWGADPIVTSVIFEENFGDFGANQTDFSKCTALSNYDKRGTVCWVSSDKSGVSFSTDGNAKGTTSSGSNCTSGHLWVVKNTTGNFTISGIPLYTSNGVKKVKVTWSQGGGSSMTCTYAFDGGSTWNNAGSTSTAGATVPASPTEITVTGHSTIALKFTRTSTNTNLRIDNIKITVTEIEASCSTPPTVGASLTSVSADANSITATVPISNIGGCNITENGLVYSASVQTPTIGTTGCTKVTTTACGATAANKEVTIENLDCGTTYYIRGYAINAAGTQYTTNTTTQATSDCPKYTVTYNAGTGSCETAQWTQPSYGAPTTLPTATTSCSGWEFAGWCTSAAGSSETNTTSPGDILTGSYTPTGDITLYAVYTKSENSSTPTTESYGFESTDDDTNWEFSDVEANTDYHKTGSKAGKIARSSTGNSTITFKNKVNVTAFSFQFMRQTSNNNYNVYIETSTDKSSWSAVETYAMSSFTSAGTWYAKSHDFDGKTALYVRIKCYTTTAIRWVDDISITYTGGSTTYYMTSLVCCDPLGSINGSFFWTIGKGYLTR